MPQLKEKVHELRDRHRELWYGIYKPLGWEVLDLRYGALMSRIDSVIYRISGYLGGEIGELPELSEKRLSITGGEEMPRTTSYLGVITQGYI